MTITKQEKVVAIAQAFSNNSNKVEENIKVINDKWFDIQVDIAFKNLKNWSF